MGKLKISPHVEKFQYNWWGFIAIYAVLLLNLLFTLFCREIFATIYALSCGEKLSSKVHLWRKMTNIRSVHDLATLTLVLLPVVTTMGRDSLLNFLNNFFIPFLSRILWINLSIPVTVPDVTWRQWLDLGSIKIYGVVFSLFRPKKDYVPES